MDRNQATGLILISGLLLVYLMFFAPKAPKPKPVDPKAKTEMAARPAPGADLDADLTLALAPADSAARAAAAGVLGAFAPAAATAADTGAVAVLTNKNLRLALGARGGLPRAARLLNYKTYYGQPLDLLTSRTGALDVVLPAATGRAVRLSQLAFRAGPVQQVKTAAGLDAQQVTLTADLGDGRAVRQTYTLPQDAFAVEYNLQLVGLNNALTTKGGAELTWLLNPTQTERHIKPNRASVTVNYRTAEGAFEHLSEGASPTPDSATVAAPLTWFTHKTPFFVSGLIAPDDQPFTSGAFRTSGGVETDSVALARLRARVGLPTAALTSAAGARFQFYFGPNDYKLLQKTAPDFGRNVYLGWGIFTVINRWLIIPIFHFLEGFMASYGIIILLLVFVVKLLLFPLTYKSYISMAKMRVLKPEIDEIKARVGEENTQAVQAETMALYQEMGVSPLAVCVPTLATIPVLYAMFSFFPNAIELRQEHFLWAKDLSSYDEFLHLPFKIPFYGDHVSLFTLLMTASTMVLTWQNNQTAAMQGPMKFYSYLMPLIFMFVLNDFAAGLTWYYLVSNLVTLGQQTVIRRMVDDNSLRAKLEANRVKHQANPEKKKGGFQARLAEAMKTAQETAQAQKEAQARGKK